jgi:hypothetical protein
MGGRPSKCRAADPNELSPGRAREDTDLGGT